MNATRIDAKQADAIARNLAKGGEKWTSSRESMGAGTPFHREWETIKYDGVPVFEIRRGTMDAGVYSLS